MTCARGTQAVSFALFTSRKKREEALRKSSGARERRQNLDTSIGWLLLLQVVLIALNAVFACAEIAVLSVNEVKLSKMVSEGNRKAKRLSRLTAQPARFLATIQVAITLAGFLGSAFAAENFSDPLVDWLVGLGVTIPPATLNTLAVILITLILSFFTLVFGELVPKRIAMKQSEKVALNISGLITVISKLFAPIVWLLSASTNGILRLLGIDPNEAVVHDVVKNHLANCRQGTQSALTRAEVSGGGKKPWRQKGTGHARQGSTRAPQWTHGGIVFAPKPRSYSYVLNKKVKRLAMKSALSAKAAAGEIIVIDSIKMDSIKTKDFRAFLTAVKADGKSLVVTPAKDEIVVKSARNIPGVETSMANLINVYDILKAKYLVLDQNALAVIEEVFA